MDLKSSRGRDLDVDLENGRGSSFEEQEGSEADSDIAGVGQARGLLSRVWSGFDGYVRSDEDSDNGEGSLEKRSDGEEMIDLMDKKMYAGRTRKKRYRKKPPKPPRPPKGPELDASDHKLVQEMSELVMLKRARMERMRALKNMRNKKGSSWGSNCCALLVTIIFCFVIIWHGLFSKGSSNLKVQDSPESPVGNRGLIAVQYGRNLTSGSHGFKSASSKYAESQEVNGFLKP